jgi:hypothetical protein
LAVGRAPYPRRIVPAGSLAIGRERRVQDRARVAFELGHQLAVGRVPHARRIVPAGGHDALAVGRESGVPGRARVAFKRDQKLATGRVPYSRRLVRAGGDHALAVGREGGVQDPVGVAYEAGQQLAVGSVPLFSQHPGYCAGLSISPNEAHMVCGSSSRLQGEVGSCAYSSDTSLLADFRGRPALGRRGVSPMR